MSVRQQRQLLLGDPSPARSADELVDLERVLAEQLADPTGRDVPAEVHLEEPVLRLHVALGDEEVVRGLGIDLRDAVVVAQHADRARRGRAH